MFWNDYHSNSEFIFIFGKWVINDHELLIRGGSGMASIGAHRHCVQRWEAAFHEGQAQLWDGARKSFQWRRNGSSKLAHAVMVKGNEEVHQRSYSEKTFSMFRVFFFSPFFPLCLGYSFPLLLQHISSSHLSKRTLQKSWLLVIMKTSPHMQKTVLSSFPSFKLAAVLWMPPSFHWGEITST